MSTLGQTATADIPPSVAMLRMISGFRVSRAIYIAAKLGIADLLKDGPKSSEELGQATGTHAPSLHRVLRVLANVGIFVGNDQRRFALTPLAATLQSDVPGSLRALAIAALGEESYQAWGDLLHSVRTGEIAFNHVFGMGQWEYQAQHPEHAKIFNESMANLIGVRNTAVLASYPFSTIDKLIDVGGGNGSFIVSVLHANPQMKGVLFDLPHVAEQARKRIADADLVERCEIIGGDFFTSVPVGGAAYILSQVIHDWDDDRAITILENCHRAMTDKGKLLLVEQVLPDLAEQSGTAQASTVIDLQMMVTTGGCERTSNEYQALLRASGFEMTNIIPTRFEMSVMECVPV